MKLELGKTEFESNNLNVVQTVDAVGKECLLVCFETEATYDEVCTAAKQVTETGVIKVTETDGNTRILSDYTIFGNEKRVKTIDEKTIQYTLFFYCKSALEIAQQAAADVEYLAAVSGVEL